MNARKYQYQGDEHDLDHGDDVSGRARADGRIRFRGGDWEQLQRRQIVAVDWFNLVSHEYLGAPGLVNAASAEPGINWTLIGTGNDPNTGDIYWGLDRFGRVDNCLWKKSTTTLVQIQYGDDGASNRTWRKDGVLTGYDELYA